MSSEADDDEGALLGGEDVAALDLPMPKIEEIYESANIHVRAMIFDPAAPITVVFTPRGWTRLPFGIYFAAKYGLNWMSVTGTGNDWMQYPDLADAERAIRAAVARFPRVVAYGGSHGGFAALLVSGAIDADAVLAISPQTFIGPDCPCGEPRWNTDWARIAEEYGCRHNIAERVSRRADIYVLYDPLDQPDQIHVDYLATIRPIKHVRSPLSGHSALMALARMGLSTTFVRDVIAGTLDLPAFQQRLHAARRGKHKAAGLIQSYQRRRREPPRWLFERAAELVTDMPSDIVSRITAPAARLGYGTVVAALAPQLVADPRYLQQPYMLAQMRDFSAVIADPEVCGRLADTLWQRAAAFEAANGSNEPPLPAVWQIRLAAAYMRFRSTTPEAALDMARYTSAFLSAWDAPSTRALARAFADFGDPDAARRYSERLLRVDRPDYEIFSRLAEQAEQAKNLIRVLEIWDEAAAAGVEPLRVAPRHCKALMDLNQFEDALKALAPVLAIKYPAVDTLRTQGMCLMQLSRYDEALAAFVRAGEILPGSAVIWCFASRALQGMHRYDEALAYAERALAVAPDDKAPQRELNRVRTLIARARPRK